MTPGFCGDFLSVSLSTVAARTAAVRTAAVRTAAVRDFYPRPRCQLLFMYSFIFSLCIPALNIYSLSVYFTRSLTLLCAARARKSQLCWIL